MSHRLSILIIASVLIFQASCQASSRYGNDLTEPENTHIIPGAWQTELYFPLLQGKKIALVGNHSSLIGKVHLADSLLDAGFELTKVFSPEHGFRGQAAAGEMVKSGMDTQTGLPVISLYGTQRRPDPKDIAGLDVIIFDIQDVGARFYTYISTMSYVMEEAARQNIPMIILDRPNPNGHYVDGPVLEKQQSSFVGLHPIPVIHGMTVAEYAQMVNGQGWLSGGIQCSLKIIPVKNYERTMWYPLPVAPSPNLPNMTSIMLYPGLCMFEGTVISLGRGTDFPFQVYGHPQLPANHFPFRFTPESRSAAPDPPQLGKLCHGLDLRTDQPEKLTETASFDISYLINAFNHFPDKSAFFNNFFDRLAGNSKLREQILTGTDETAIRKSWQKGIADFREMRKAYLLYSDLD
jgi:uncharacterized protein YbbC (DUF1343 family)